MVRWDGIRMCNQSIYPSIYGVFKRKESNKNVDLVGVACIQKWHIQFPKQGRYLGGYFIFVHVAMGFFEACIVRPIESYFTANDILGNQIPLLLLFCFLILFPLSIPPYSLSCL